MADLATTIHETIGQHRYVSPTGELGYHLGAPACSCGWGLTEPHYPAGHGWTPAGRFGPQRCKVLLARYPCPYPREEHDPTLPIEDVDFSGRRRKHTEVPDADA